MKKIFSILVATILVATSAISTSAGVVTQEQLDNLPVLTEAAGVKVVPVDARGIVTVPKSISPDNLQHKLVQLEENTAAAVMMANQATTFSTLDYKVGVFDLLPTTAYTLAWPTEIIKSNIFDNQLDTNATLSRDIWHSIKLNYPIKIEGLYYNTTLSGITVNFLNNGKSVGYQGMEGKEGYRTFTEITADQIDILSRSASIQSLNEFDVFGDITIDYETVSNIEVTDIDYTSANITFNNPTQVAAYSQTEIFVNDKSVYKGTKTTQSLTGLKMGSVQNVVFRAHYKDGNYVDTLYTFKTLADTTPPAEVTELKAQLSGEDIKLTFTLPPDKDFDHVKIFRNGILLKDNHKELVFIDENPVENSNNNYKVVAVDEVGNKSAGESITIKHVGTSVYNVKASAIDYTSVVLDWKNPPHEDFKNVTIYRKDENQNIVKRIISFFSNGDGYEPLFETNGTVFKDMTVAAATTYSYKLTTTINDTETSGVFVDITTPKISVVGGETNINQNKDYVFSWTAPTSGKVKVLIAGKEYKIVNAADKQVIIESSAMKYDFLGAPQVTLVPIDEQGNEGIATKPPGSSGSGSSVGGTEGQIKLPSELSTNNTLMLAVQLLAVVGGFVLLGLAFALAPKLIRVIKEAFERRRGVTDGR